MFIFLPGGFGTLDEFFELITLLQTGRMEYRPVILVGKKFWLDLLAWCKLTLIPEGMINVTEFDRIHVVDSIADIEILFPKFKLDDTR